MKPIMSVLVCCFMVISCQSTKANKELPSKPQQQIATKVNNCRAIEPFNSKDSTGFCGGTIVDFSDTTQSMSQGLLQLATSNNDTVIFNFDYDEISKFDIKKVMKGACVKVSYYAEIQRVEVDGSEDGNKGDEISRHFYIKEIKFLSE
jgi:hypothetical protein